MISFIPKLTKKQLRLAIALLILAVAIIIALLARALSPKINTADFRVYYDERKTVPYEDTVRGGVIYINLFDLAEYCRLTVTGTPERVKLFSSDDQYAYFTASSAVADVCGDRIVMSGEAQFRDNAMWIPCDFVNSVFRGVNIVIDTEHNKLSVWRDKAEGSTEARPVYKSITFDRSSATSPNADKQDVAAMIDGYTFLTDMKKYEKYLDPNDSRYLMLVNKQNLLGDAYVPDELSTIDPSFVIYGGTKQLESCAAMALEAMMQEMRAAGYDDVYVTSAYRDYAYQSALFATYIDREMSSDPDLSYSDARELVLTYSAEPGSSEHQSGLCLDLITTSMSDLDETFAAQPVYAWLLNNAHKFGFILRYPADKVEITGYSYEPWHYRFVGQSAAAEMYLTGQCLEEYLGQDQ